MLTCKSALPTEKGVGMSWHIHTSDSIFDSDGYGSDEDEYDEPERTDEDFEYELERDERYIDSLERRFD